MPLAPNNNKVVYMGELTAKTRKAIPTAKFAGPGRSYPVEDKSHAGNAKARAKQMMNKGHINSAEYDKIVAKANKVLGKGRDKDGD